MYLRRVQQNFPEDLQFVRSFESTHWREAIRMRYLSNDFYIEWESYQAHETALRRKKI